uniref:Putative secreted protein n=1 Tax=Anopheles darlingi TaxID=43151 RepID=A0A2M4DG88_ANODA
MRTLILFLLFVFLYLLISWLPSTLLLFTREPFIFLAHLYTINNNVRLCNGTSKHETHLYTIFTEFVPLRT